ncbi:uncharacterized protein LOC116340012 isoform X2 [Contarinia nasturtii]|uniref:uncharacterized protein LOC116340012 isoform X2 n=1 Tax=Contarinia nasturtii TaxID=265458 RepID=UPI0012D3C1A1|nr:uncharacterized protein LOC116340012 isoform X2 [Contarinia nasturtii]
MLSNSNVFILLILIIHSILFEFTLANLVAVNAHAKFDETKITTIETVTTATSTSSSSSTTTASSYVAHFIDGQSRTTTTKTASSRIKDKIANIKVTTTKDPLETGNRKQFPSTINEYNSIATTHRVTIINTIPTTTLPLDRATKFNEIPFNATSTKNAHNGLTKFEMVSSTLANKNATISPQTEEPTLDPKPLLTSASTPNTLKQQFNHQGNLEINSNQSRSHANAQNRSSSLMGSNNQIIDDNDNTNIKTLDYLNGHSNDDKTDYVNSNIHLLPQSDAPSSSSAASMNPSLSETNMKSTRSDVVYFVVAVIGGAKIWARTLAQTLSDMGPPFNDSSGSPLRPIYVDLPTNGRFSVNVLLSLCQQSEKRPLAGVVVIGNGQSAHAIAHAGSAMQLPVLWAKGGTTNLHEIHPEASLQALLQPSAIEIFEAVRSLFLQTHWHSFFVLSDVQATNVMNVKDNPLKRPPLVPTIVPLPRNNEDVFKQLAQISRSTRGVILLLGNVQATRRIMTEAHRLNMVGGHFIWLWIDTSTSTGYFHQATVPVRQSSKPQHQTTRSKANASSVSGTTSKSGLEPKSENRKSSDKQMQTSTPTYDGDVYDVNSPKKMQSTKVRQSSNRSGEETALEADEDDGSSSSSKVNVDFSQGFDPFRVLLEQHQDEQLKQTFGTPQHYQERTAQRDNNKQTPTNNRLILGLRSESTAATETEEPTKEKKKKIQRRSSSTNNKTKSRYNNINTNAQRHSEIDDDAFYDEHDEMPIFLSNQTISSKNRIYNNKYRNFSDDNLDDFIDNNNFNESPNLKSNFKRTSTVNGSTSSLPLPPSSFVNFHQFKDFPVGLLALRPIRMNVDRHFIRAAVRLFAATWEKINSSKSILNSIPSQQRPITTSSSSSMPQSRRTQQNRNAQGTTTLYNAKKFGNEMNSRKMRRKRNIHTVNKLLVKIVKLENVIEHDHKHEHYGEYDDDDADDAVVVDEVRKQTEPQTVPAKMQVNSSLFLKELNSISDKNKNSVTIERKRKRRLAEQKTIDKQLIKFNSSFTSDLPNNNDNINKNTNNTYYINNSDSVNLTNVNVSFNRNFSGLWKQNSKNKSNIHSLNGTRHQQIIVSDESSSNNNKTLQFNASNVTNQPVAVIAAQLNRNDPHSTTESMAKQASQSIVENFLNHRSSEDVRHSSPYKRQNTWWSTKKDIPTLATQYKRPQYDTNNKNANQLANAYRITDHDYTNPIKCETPSYFGGCYGTSTRQDIKNAEYFSRALREATKLALSGRTIYNGINEKALTTNFDLLNLVPSDHPYHAKVNNNQSFQSKSTAHSSNNKEKRSTTTAKGSNGASTTKWRRVGLVSASSVQLDTIVWPGGDIVVSGLSAGARTVFRIVTALAPPFVMESELDEDGLCLRGLPCHRVSPVGRHNLTLMFNAIETRDRLEEDAVEHGNDLPPEPEHLDEKISHVTKCCYGLTMDLLDNIATELSFEFHLYVVRDQLFGSKQQRDVEDFIKTNSKLSGSNGHDEGTPNKPTDHDVDEETSNTDQWNGIIGDLVSGSADMSFASLSVSKDRAKAIDFSIPYFHSGVSLLASPKRKSEIPLLAFLLPFSPELWIAIFTSLNITAVAVAVYEWLSPFGLNPWGRQRSKNFSLSSALWVMWGLLCGHLVAFKAPKSWPNKFLINVWGGFSVIFVASYTANIAALIAGLFFHHAASSYDSSLTTQKVGAPIASAAESYVQNKDKHLWEHMKKYSLNHIEDGIRGLKNGTLDLLMADSPILDYYRATDHGCSLQRIGETFVEDTYAIGFVKGFPLRESISALIAKYSSNGYLDILTEKWYGGLPCFKYEAEIVTPRPLGVAAVAGVFLLLGLGMVMGVVILIFEHWFYKYALPSLRLKPKGTIWKSRNIMFFSQKLYRFINCVELVSPHHAARELVHSIRQGQIASLFQKSIKREDEQRRRRKSKAQFFEMIQEIRRAQQVERQNLAAVAEAESQKDTVKSPPLLFKPRASPKPGIFSALKKDGRSRSNSSVLTPRRFSTDSILGDRLDSIGRRLSRDLTNSPPDLNRRYDFGGKNDLSPNKYDTISGSNLSALGISKSNETLSSRYDTFSGKNVEKTSIPVKLKKHGKRPKISFESYHRDSVDDKDECEDELPAVKEGLEPSFLQEDRPTAILRLKLHEELRAKHPPIQTKSTTTVVDQVVPNSVIRPPMIPKKVVIVRHQRQKSLDNLDVVQTDKSKTSSSSSPYKSDESGDSLTKMNQRSQISLERLSREDLLRLSHSSQSEIHEYLKGSSLPDRSAEPP